VSKPVPVRCRFQRSRAATLATLATLSTVSLGSVSAASGAPRRFVSSQAYHHALVADYAAVNGDASRVDANLQLARIYDDDSPWLARRLAESAWRRGEIDRAHELARRIDAKANLLLAQIALLEGRSAEAMRRMTVEILRDPQWDRDAVEALLAFESRSEGRMLWALARPRISADERRWSIVRRFSEARPWSDWTFELVGPTGGLPPPEALPAVARVLHHQGRDHQAADLAARARRVWPGHRAVLETAARTAAWIDDEPERVARAWRRAWPAGRLAACRVLAEEGYPGSAARLCPGAPPRARARWLLANLDADAAWRALGSQPPEAADALAEWLDVALAADRARIAVARWDDAERARADPAIWHRWVRALWVAGRRARARAALAEPPTGPVTPAAAGRIHALLVRHRDSAVADAWLRGQVSRAADRLDALLVSADVRLDPDAWAAYAGQRAELGPLDPGVAARAWTLGALGPAEAADRAVAALRLRHPDEPAVLDAAARRALAAGCRARARALAARAARLRPRDPDAWALLGFTLRDHDLGRATRAWRTALRLYERRPAEGWAAAEEATRRVRRSITPS
jgi:tetratricopeptide (TPR) repeat protein